MGLLDLLCSPLSPCACTSSTSTITSLKFLWVAGPWRVAISITASSTVSQTSMSACAHGAVSQFALQTLTQPSLPHHFGCPSGSSLSATRSSRPSQVSLSTWHILCHWITSTPSSWSQLEILPPLHSTTTSSHFWRPFSEELLGVCFREANCARRLVIQHHPRTR